MVKFLKNISVRFWKFISKRDIYVIIFSLILMHNLHWVVEQFYPIVGEPSMVWIYTTIFGLTRASMVVGYAYLMFRIFFPIVYGHLETNFAKNFIELEWRKKLYISLLLYAFFLVFFLVSVVTM